MMDFASTLQRITEALDDVKGVALAGMDGLVVAEIGKEPGIDLHALAAEHTRVIRSAEESFERADSGECVEISLASEGVVLLSRKISPDYFILLVLGSEGNPGKGRYLLKREGEILATTLSL